MVVTRISSFWESIRRRDFVIPKPEFFFATTALVFGLAFILLIPPFQTPDENVHIYRAYELSELKLPSETSGEKHGSYLPAAIRETEIVVHGNLDVLGVSKGQLQFNYNEKYRLGYTKGALFDIKIDDNNRIFYNTAGNPVYNPISYVPQALATAFLRLCGAPFIVIVYAIRFLNLLIWIIITYFAIKIIPCRKWTIAGISLLPVVLSQAISPGLDPVINACTAMIIALSVRTLHDETFKLSVWGRLALLVGTTLITLGKPPMILLIITALFITRGFQEKNTKIKLKPQLSYELLLIVVPLVIVAIWGILSKGMGDTTNSAIAERFMSIFTNPLLFPSFLFQSLFLYTPGGLMVIQSLVGSFGWLDAPVSPLIMAFGLAYISLILVLRYEPLTLKAVNDRARSFINFMVLIYSVVIFLAMYLFFTTSSDHQIRGVQGRYFIPVLLFGTVSWQTINFVCREKSYAKLIVYGSMVMLMISAITIFARYYTPYIIT